MSLYEEKWRALELAARDYAETADMAQATKLADAASAYARAREANEKGAKPAQSSAATVRLPMGRSKNLPLAEAPTDDLKWVLGIVTQSISDPEKSRYLEANKTMAAAIESELLSRGES